MLLKKKLYYNHITNKSNIFLLLLIIFSILSNCLNLRADNCFKESSKSVGIDHRTQDGLVFAGGVCVFDYDNDGLDDVFYTGGELIDHLYKNLGNGKFKDVTKEAGLLKTNLNLITSGATSGDIDNDGDRDLFITTRCFQPNILFLNDGKGHFTNISESAGITHKSYSTSATFGDFNNDSYLDIYVVNYAAELRIACNPNFLYINNGNNTFTENAVNLGIANDGCGFAATFSDYDNDGDVDLFLANDFGYEQQKPNMLYQNQYPVQGFKDIGDQSNVKLYIYGMSCMPNDFNDDGYLDYFFSNYGANILDKNNHKGIFEDVTAVAGMDIAKVPKYEGGILFNKASWGGAWIDYDNDTHVDLFLSNGYVESDGVMIRDPSYLYKSEGNGHFLDVTASEGITDSNRSRGVAFLDFDNDGDADIAANIVCLSCTDENKEEHSTFYINQNNNNNHWLKVKLRGVTINRDAFGSKVMVYIDGRILTREVDGGGGSFQSQSSSTLMFGLGKFNKIDSLAISWLGGKKTIIKNIKIDTLLNISEDLIREQSISICQNTYFKGKLIVENTVVEDRLPQKGGYDSLIVYHVKTIEPKWTVIDTAICKNQKYNQKLYQTDTNFINHFVSYQNCDSIVETKIRVNPYFKYNLEDSICYAGYYWGKQYFSDQIITNYLTTQNGCDSIIIANLKIKPTPKFKKDTTICWGSNFNGDVYFDSTIISHKYPNIEGCDSIFLQQINVLPRKYTKLKDTILLNVGDLFHGTEYNKPGIYVSEQKYISYQNCDSTIATTIKVLDINSINHSEEKVEVCFTFSPNPSTNFTEISFCLNSKELVKISVYDFNGKTIRTIVDKILDEGKHTTVWNNTDSKQNQLENGLYIIKFETKDYTNELRLLINN